MEEAKKYYRLVPFPAYDVEHIESWLADMAKEGMHLEKKNAFMGFLTFTKGMPAAVRYRLEPKPKSDSQDAEYPDSSFIALCEEYGWEFVAVYSQFYIYRAIRPDAREMHTDLEVQATVLKIMRKRASAQWPFQNIPVICFIVVFLQHPFRNLVNFGAGFCLLLLFLAAVNTLYGFLRNRHLRRLEKQLSQGISLDHQKPWKHSASAYRRAHWTMVGIHLLCLALLVSRFLYAASVQEQPLSTFTGEPPFVTIADLCPGGEYTPEKIINSEGYFEAYSSDCAPVNIQWRECATVTSPEGETVSGLIIVNYHETSAPWIARGLAEDYRRDALRSSGSYEVLEVPELGLDYVYCYSDVGPYIILQHGNIIIKAYIGIVDSDRESLLDEWATQMAARLTA